MKLWQRAAGAFKDKHSVFIAGFTKKSTLRNPDIETSVIRATSHDATCIDFKNSQRVFAWMRMSPVFVKPFSWAISVRMEKTRSWVVALKGLMLVHGVLCCKTPAIHTIGRLPFDLSSFVDRHSSHRKSWVQNHFIRSYYAFLDQKSSFLFLDSHQRYRKSIRKEVEDDYGEKEKEKDKEEDRSFMQVLLKLQKIQGLLDLLLQIKPQERGIMEILILEAMDCVLVEIFDTYSAICHGIGDILMRNHSVGKVEAAIALNILHKANAQADELIHYFDFCRSIGVINASDCPEIDKISEVDIRPLEFIINSSSKMNKTEEADSKAIVLKEEIKSVVAVETNHQQKNTFVDNWNYSEKRILVEDTKKNFLKTIITHNWELFDESNYSKNANEQVLTNKANNLARANPFADYSSSLALVPLDHAIVEKDLPDLITF